MTTRHPGRRIKRSNGHRHRAHEDDNLGVMTGWCQARGDLDEVKKQLHDTLIQLMGAYRSGGVSWHIVEDRTRALELIEDMREGAAGPHLELYRTLENLLFTRGGILVVATAPGQPGWTYTNPNLAHDQEKPAP